jgi:hypothetical protein
MAKPPVYEVRECATLGTYFRDIYEDGELFAMEIPTEVAEWAVGNPQIFLGNAGASIQKLRTWIIENEYKSFTGKPLP